MLIVFNTVCNLHVFLITICATQTTLTLQTTKHPGTLESMLLTVYNAYWRFIVTRQL